MFLSERKAPRLLILLGFRHALRVSELVGVRWQQIPRCPMNVRCEHREHDEALEQRQWLSIAQNDLHVSGHLSSSCPPSLSQLLSAWSPVLFFMVAAWLSHGGSHGLSLVVASVVAASQRHPAAKAPPQQNSRESEFIGSFE